MTAAIVELLRMLAVVGVMLGGGGYALASALRWLGMSWTWALLGLPVGPLFEDSHPMLMFWLVFVSVIAGRLGARWQRADLALGGKRAEMARARLGIRAVLLRGLRELKRQRDRVVADGWLVVGRTGQGRSVSIPIGDEFSGSHALILGATGSGKTVTETWVVGRMIDSGRGAVVIDPKGDGLLRAELEAAAARRGVPFLEWTPEGPLAYNPYAHGTSTEIADKALSGEHFSEPHYLRQAQRYMGHAVRAMHGAGVQVTPRSLMEHMDARQLEATARALPEEQARAVQSYLDSLGDRQRRDLSGVRDRLSILTESEVGRWFDPTAGDAIDLRAAIEERAVVYFRLDSDRRPLLAAMLAAALISDLITVVADLHGHPVGTVVLIDEFSAVAAGHVSRLFGRARSAGMSLILATQELADLKSVGDGALREQVLGNVQTIIAHRQNVPESAQVIAELAGHRPTWTYTQQTQDGLFGSRLKGSGTRRLAEEFEIAPDRVRNLRAGEAAVITPGSGKPPTVVRIHHPRGT